MQCLYCGFRFFDEDWDALLAHIEERHPRIFRRKYVKHPEDVRVELVDEEYEETGSRVMLGY